MAKLLIAIGCGMLTVYGIITKEPPFSIVIIGTFTILWAWALYMERGEV